MTQRTLFAGLMSGTSLDGVDAALVSFDDERPLALGTHYLPFPDDVRAECLALQSAGTDELHRSMILAQGLCRLYADGIIGLLDKCGVSAAAVNAIGCHGQTLRHRPDAGYSIQLNQPAMLAELTGIRVVADFRSRDIAAGGQGAPLVPAFHDAVFRCEDERRVVVNIGGIANLTELAPGRPTLGFDCGPGNMLMDAWIAHCRGDRFDAGGEWARQGAVLPALLNRLQQHPFFSRAAPKSCGREEFNLAWLKGALSGHEAAADVQATLVELTAWGIASAVLQQQNTGEGLATTVLLCGGGARNDLLRARIAAMLPRAQVKPTDALGVGADWVEAMAFAWLARQTINGQPGNLPAVTGARGPRVLGAIYPA